MIDELLNKPYWIIDILPEQVPADSAGQYARVERYCLEEPRYTALRRRFAGILLKLSCYYDLRVTTPDEELILDGPAPDRLVSLLTGERRDLLILLEGENCLISLNQDDTYMTVYNPSGTALKRLEWLAASEGLFLWQPPRAGSAQ